MLGDSSESNLEESDDSDVEFSSTIDVGKIIAIYSSETVNEPFLSVQSS